MATISWKFYTVTLKDGKKYWFSAKNMKDAKEHISVEFVEVTRGCDLLHDTILPDSYRRKPK